MGLGSVIEVRTLRLLGESPRDQLLQPCGAAKSGNVLFIRVFLDTFPFSGSLLTPSLYTSVPSLARMRRSTMGSETVIADEQRAWMPRVLSRIVSKKALSERKLTLANGDSLPDQACCQQER